VFGVGDNEEQQGDGFLAKKKCGVGSLPQSSVAITERLIPILMNKYSWMI
jgi:hypothetical protein